MNTHVDKTEKLAKLERHIITGYQGKNKELIVELVGELSRKITDGLVNWMDLATSSLYLCNASNDPDVQELSRTYHLMSQHMQNSSRAW